MRFTFAMLVILLSAGPAAAVVIDGHLESEYGPPWITQTTATQFDNPSGFSADSVASSFGSELDAAYALVSGGVLYLFLPGNLKSFLGELPHQDQLHVFIDCQPGGQNVLRGDNADVGFFSYSTLNALAGLTFDAGFSPDYWFACTVDETSPPVRAAYARLLDTGGGEGYILGSAAAGGPGTLSGGTNPYGVLVTVDNSNSSGVTAGCGPSSGAGATKGIEWAIPLEAIGRPEGAIKLCCIIGDAYGSNGYLWNQVLGPVPPGSCALGDAANVNFASLAGDQFFTVYATSAVASGAPNVLALSVPQPNPFVSATRLRLTLAREGLATVTVRDVAGRGIATLIRGTLGAGSRDIAWDGTSDEGRAVPSAIYFVQAQVAGERLVRKAVFIGGR